MASIRGFKPTFTIMGVIYVLLASSMLVRGPAVLRDFAVPEAVATEPVLRDFFLFFYLLMAFVGVLTILFGQVTRERRAQLLVAGTFCVWNLVAAGRDLLTSDSRFGNHLYKGEATLVFVWIDLAFAVTFASLIVRTALFGKRERALSESEEAARDGDRGTPSNPP